VFVTYPYLSLTVACLAYLTSIPFGVRRYLEQKRAVGVAETGETSILETVLPSQGNASKSGDAKLDKLETEEAQSEETDTSQRAPQKGPE
jgi:hypothetical protein